MKKRIYDFLHPITPKEYYKILEMANNYCDRFYFVIPNTAQMPETVNHVINSLQPFVADIQKVKEWPGTVIYSEGYNLLYTYYLNKESEKALKGITNDLYSWTKPVLPEDLGFLRKDGSPWFISITHEKDCYMELTDKEKGEFDEIFPDLLISHSEQEKNIITRSNNDLDIASDMLFTAFAKKSLRVYLEAKFYLCKAWYDEITNDIKRQVNYKNILNMPSLAIFYEFEDDLNKILEDPNTWYLISVYNNDLDSSKVQELIKQKKQLEDSVKKFVISNIKISTKFIEEYLSELIDRYSEIYSVLKYANLEHWQDELYNIFDIRNDIHYAKCFASDNDVEINKELISKIIDIDKTVQNHFSKKFVTFSQDNTSKANNTPNSHWWWHLHELDKLSKKDLETI
ncbi:MAG: hypothetical protein AAB881_01880 [Patescibacteria group bacterium]